MSRFDVPQALERRLRRHSSATITANPLITSAAPIHLVGYLRTRCWKNPFRAAELELAHVRHGPEAPFV